VQIAACLFVIVWADVRLDDFGRLFWNDVLELGWLAMPVTIFAALGVINSFNLIDGMDGLAGGIFLVAAAGMALLAGLAGQTQILQLLLLAIAAVAGFLLLNALAERAGAIFMGDSGSMLLGFLLAWCFIALGNDRAYTAERAFMPLTAVWLFAVPLLDTTTQIWRRWRAYLPVFGADQHHLHHAFLRAVYHHRLDQRHCWRWRWPAGRGTARRAGLRQLLAVHRAYAYYFCQAAPAQRAFAAFHLQ
jgi:UDP-GlcNAc:undecaprenyl-phosphate GlcNAc-1-phosphate transferase